LHLIAAYSASGGAGYAIEFSGSTVKDLSVESRFTLCNMAVEFSAFTGIIAPDHRVVEYLSNRPYLPKNKRFDEAVAYWRTLYSDPDASFDLEINIDSADVAPTVTWGTSPQHAIA